ncbi:hypothetical protein PRIPAC_78793 [Pristionchus pacificus]|nr:hypothetical protein PRIPAC_78793 [Pristionchus pacificus]
MGLTDNESQNNRYDGSLTDGVKTKGKWRNFSLVISLIIISGISFYETSALDGCLPLLQKHFVIRDSQTALINTFSSLTHTLSLLSLWIFGDFIERKKLLCYSISCWIICCFLSLTAQPSFYWVFVLLRSLSSIFSSIFGVLIPVVLADIFDDRSLGKALMFLTFVQMSTGIISSSVTSWFVTSSLPWFSPLIVAPFFSLPILPIIICLMKVQNVVLIDGYWTILRNVQHDCKFFLDSNFSSFSMELCSLCIYRTLLSNGDHIKFLHFTSRFDHRSSTCNVDCIFMEFRDLVNHKNERAFPIVFSIGSLSTVVVYLIVLLSTGRNYFISSIFLFLTGFCSASEGALGQLMLLVSVLPPPLPLSSQTIVPRRSRSSAVSLSRLITGIATIPAAQFVGLVRYFHKFFISLFNQLSDIFSFESDTMENRFISFRNVRSNYSY